MTMSMLIYIFIISINMFALAFTQTSSMTSSYDIPDWVYNDVFTHNLPTRMYRTNTLEFHNNNVRTPAARKSIHYDNHHPDRKTHNFEDDAVKQMNEAFIDAFNDIYYDEIQKKLLDAKEGKIPRFDEIEPEKESTKVPCFDDYTIPSWVYKKVFKHNRPRVFKEKKHVFWDRIKPNVKNK